MINKKKQHLLVPTSQLLVFNKDLKNESEVYSEYGWNNSKPVYERILGYLIDGLKEEIDTQDISTKKDGSNIITKYGIQRIHDKMLLKEMAGYGDGKKGNFDRIISAGSLIAYIKIQEANLGFRKRQERVQNEDLEKSYKMRNFIYGGPTEKPQDPFKRIGNPFSKIR